LLSAAGKVVALLPEASRRGALNSIYDRHFDEVVQTLGPRLNRAPVLDSVPFDLEPNGGVEFEHLAGLFASHSLAQGVIGQSIRQAAYTFGLIRQLEATSAIEIGRWKGGLTVLIAAALGPQGRLWSIDNNTKEERLRQQTAHGRPFDEQIHAFLDRLGLHGELIVGDSHTVEVETGEVDVVVIDGDHTYDGTHDDFERWGKRVRVGGYVLVDDAVEGHDDTAGRVAAEAVASGEFEQSATVDRLIALRRVH
jgi:predicted O-methyltransferase YrrM